MSEKENKNQKPQGKPVRERKSNSNIEKVRDSGSFRRERSTPLSWQPIKDQTDSNPPDGGSGVGDSKD